MADKKVNYNGTKVEAIVSQSEIIKELTIVGFSETGQHTKDGTTTIFGGYNGANFIFRTSIPDVIEKLISEKGRATQIAIELETDQGMQFLENIKTQAIRVAWRHTYHYVKAVCACIHIGAVEVGHAFAGHLAIKDEQGQLVTMGTQLTKQIAAGKVAPTHIFNQFAIEDKRKNKN